MALTWREIGVLSDAANLDDCGDEDEESKEAENNIKEDGNDLSQKWEKQPQNPNSLFQNCLSQMTAGLGRREMLKLMGKQ